MCVVGAEYYYVLQAYQHQALMQVGDAAIYSPPKVRLLLPPVSER
jgi:hypothetical protein